MLAGWILVVGCRTEPVPIETTGLDSTAPLALGPCEDKADWTFEEVPVVCVATCEGWTLECQGGDCVLFDGEDQTEGCAPDGGDGHRWCRDAVSCFFPPGGG